MTSVRHVPPCGGGSVSKKKWNRFFSAAGHGMFGSPLRDFPHDLRFSSIFAIKMPQFPRRTYDLWTNLMLGWELSFALVQSRLSLLNSACSTCSLSICVLYVPMIPGELQFWVFKPQLWWYIYIYKYIVCVLIHWLITVFPIDMSFVYIIYIYTCILITQTQIMITYVLGWWLHPDSPPVRWGLLDFKSAGLVLLIPLLVLNCKLVIAVSRRTSTTKNLRRYIR